MLNITSMFKSIMPKKKEKDLVAELLKANPEALAQFEATYAKHTLNMTTDDLFGTNSRQASEQNRVIDPDTLPIEADLTQVQALEDKIVSELLAQTQVYILDDSLRSTTQVFPALPEGESEVTAEDIYALPQSVRPQLSGNLMHTDIQEQTYKGLLYFWDIHLHGKTPQLRAKAYHHFRQGLDILDLDAITYEIINTNRNSMGYWLPALVNACQGQTFFKIPATRIAKVPLTMLQLTRQEYSHLTQTTLDIVDKWATKAFELDEHQDYFIKTGTFSSKFDFRNAKVTGEKEVRELGEYLLFIHYQALQMASPLCEPCIYGASTTVEWVVREFIEDKEGNPCIYKGMPLRTEYRFFIDCDTDRIIGCTPYWEPNTMKQRFGNASDANSPHQIHDYIIYKAHEGELMSRYYSNIDLLMGEVTALLPHIDLKGQWSLDIMQSGSDFWLIDMALAESSAFYECVPKKLRKPIPEDWMPKLPPSMSKTNK